MTLWHKRGHACIISQVTIWLYIDSCKLRKSVTGETIISWSKRQNQKQLKVYTFGCNLITMRKSIQFIVLLALLLSIKHAESSKPTQTVLQNASIEQCGCPPWFTFNSETGNCECQRSPGTDDIVKCTEQGALLRYGFCMTYEEGQGTFVGRCQSFEVQGHNVSETSPGFMSLPANISELNQYMCGPMNRKGLVCSECIESFGPAATFYGFSCSSCTNPWFILLYLFIEFVPITIFYLIILVFRVGLTSSPFTAFVLFSQFAVTAVTAAFGPYSFETSPVIYYFSVVISFYGFWNLDFFRFLIPPFCISSSLQVIHIVFLGYISAFYPLILIGITWICINLHSQNFKAFVWMGNKLDRLIFKRMKRESKSTIIDVFSTFLLLSYTKILGIFVDTIEPDFILNINNLPTRRVLLVDPSIEWFGIENGTLFNRIVYLIHCANLSSHYFASSVSHKNLQIFATEVFLQWTH